ncbi:MAG: RsmB/NOP family class I SAM-dependent RNA methyltransferase [Nitratireductor sp.]
MRLGGRIQAAIEVLDDIAERNRPASMALKDWGLSHRFAGGGDRSAIGNLVYDSLRRMASQGWRMDDTSSHSLVFATLADQWGMAPDKITIALDGDMFAPALPAQERWRAWETRDLADAPDHVRSDIPQWCATEFEALLGDDWVAEAAALSARPPLDLRVNTLKSNRDKVLKQLAHTGVVAADHAPDGIRIAAGLRDSRLPNVQAEAGYQKGWFEVQDEGSQLAARLSLARPGEQVMDYCAGGGGKTLAMAAMMENRGQIHAHDSDKNRLAPIHERIRRAGVHNAQVLVPGGDHSALEGRMDCVLVDAPCTGSGTWRRRPDSKWRLSAENLAERIGEQDKVLGEAARFVRPGGRLVYVTCSMFASENTSRVKAFAAANLHFRPLPLAASLGELCKNTQFRTISDTSVALAPLRTGTDGFFIAAFQRS